MNTVTGRRAATRRSETYRGRKCKGPVCHAAGETGEEQEGAVMGQGMSQACLATVVSLIWPGGRGSFDTETETANPQHSIHLR